MWVMVGGRRHAELKNIGRKESQVIRCADLCGFVCFEVRRFHGIRTMSRSLRSRLKTLTLLWVSGWTVGLPYILPMDEWAAKILHVE